MGMSASQARLLSITSRLSDNELRSQSIANAKSALSAQTNQASSEYLSALNSTQMYFSNYDTSGNKIYERLTAASLSQYAPLKNQYGIINTEGQVMVSELDAANYLESATLGEFLAKYGVAEVNDVEVENPKFIDKAIFIFGSDWESWINNNTGTAGGFMALEPQLPDYNKIEKVVNKDGGLYQRFLDASAPCYNVALGIGDTPTPDPSTCYLHVLAHLLDFDENCVDENGEPVNYNYPRKYKTTYGQEISVGFDRIRDTYINNLNKTADMVPISDAVCNGVEDNIIYAAEDANDKAKFEALLENENNIPTNEVLAGKLLNNYYLNENGEIVLKTLKQKIIDLFYAVQEKDSLNINYDPTLKNAIKRFQEDMVAINTTNTLVPDEEAWKKDHDKWEEELQAHLEELYSMERYLTDNQITYTDKDAAQWYVNLWHRMNGASDYKVNIDGVDNGAKPTKNYLGMVEEEEKYSSMDNTLYDGLTDGGKLLWTVLEDGLMNNAEWIQYALTKGNVTLERVNFTEPTLDGSGMYQATWTSIIYSNALDISEQENEAAITKAEVKYEQTLRDIEAKDKQYDNIIRRLDTEHNALQTEYETIKGVIKKNVERTLKMYS